MTGVKNPKAQARQTKKQQLQIEYKKQLKNLKARIKGYEKRGYYLDKDVIPTQPKNITQSSINKLKNIRGEKLLKKGKASYIDIETGEIQTVKQHKEQLKQIRKFKTLTKKLPRVEDIQEKVKQINIEQPLEQPLYNETPPKFSEIIIRNYLDTMKQFSSAPLYNRVLSWFNRIRDKYTDDDIAKMLQDGAEAGNVLTWYVFYDEQECARYITEMTSYMPEMTEQWVKNFMDDLEELDGESYNI